jgi:hypothetical protein
MSGAHNSAPAGKGLSTLVRPKFGPGMLLQHEDLDALHEYTRELNRLLFRSFFGCGVVCGLVVKFTFDNCGRASIVLQTGLALSGEGDPIYVPKDQSILIDPDCDPDLNGPLWVVLCATSRSCAPRTSMCPTDDDDTSSSPTRERFGYEIRIVDELPRCACDCRPHTEPPKTPHVSNCLCVDPTLPCYLDHYAGICGCTCDDCGAGGCNCVVLARLDRVGDTTEWTADHSVRRFIRPVLMRDPQVALEIAARTAASGSSTGGQEVLQEVAYSKRQADKSQTKTSRAAKTPQA